jgi:hypothetical protein
MLSKTFLVFAAICFVMLYMKIFIGLHPRRPFIEYNILNREFFPKGKEMFAAAKSEEQHRQ